MLADNYPNGVDKIQVVRDSNYAYSMTNNKLQTGFLFRQIFTVDLFTSKDFSANVFTVGEKAKSYQINNKTQKLIKEEIHIILTFSRHSDSCVRILLLVWEPVYKTVNGCSFFFVILCK